MVRASFTMAIEPEDVDRLRLIAQKEDCSIARLVRRAIRDFIDGYADDEAARMLHEELARQDARRLQINVAPRYPKAAKSVDPNFGNPSPEPEDKE